MKTHKFVVFRFCWNVCKVIVCFQVQLCISCAWCDTVQIYSVYIHFDVMAAQNFKLDCKFWLCDNVHVYVIQCVCWIVFLFRILEFFFDSAKNVHDLW